MENIVAAIKIADGRLLNVRVARSQVRALVRTRQGTDTTITFSEVVAFEGVCFWDGDLSHVVELVDDPILLCAQNLLGSADGYRTFAICDADDLIILKVAARTVALGAVEASAIE